MEEIQGRAFVQALVKQIDLIKFPELVIGFKVKDQALAKEQLDHLESNLQMALAEQPPLQNRLKRTTIDGHSYLTFKLDGSMIPWDPGVVEKIRSLAATPGRRRQADRTPEEDHPGHLAGPPRRLPAAGDRAFDRRAGPAGQRHAAAFAAGTGCRGQVRRQADLLGRLPEQDLE